jgi:DNA-directed RNA polymerase subunit H (RpoH/RPB5)|tara:strand:+ start:2871 stop:3407 length:537 start_codon:yes stop_codon:yes gene_type:complete
MNDQTRTTLIEMLSDRGHTEIKDVDESLIIASKPNSEKKIMVYRVRDPKVSVKNIKQLKSIIDDYEAAFSCLIVIYKTSISTFAKQFISSEVEDILVQLFSEKELRFNITKHDLVPIHRVLPLNEKATLLSRFKITQLPVILSSDPVCRYYGCLPGNIMEITRESETCDLYTLYRLVV